jgi:hypothetical protein
MMHGQQNIKLISKFICMMMMMMVHYEQLQSKSLNYLNPLTPELNPSPSSA